MRRLAWAERAKRDVASIADYWRPERPDYVVALFRALDQATDFLMTTPGAGSPAAQSDLRKWRIGRTPYVILYRFSRSELRIVRVHHEHQNWRED